MLEYMNAVSSINSEKDSRNAKWFKNRIKDPRIESILNTQ